MFFLSNKKSNKAESIRLELCYFFQYAYERTILSDVLTKTRAAPIGITIITTARITLLKNALNDGVI